MKEIRCEMCGSNDLVKNGEFFVCQYCGAKYTPDEARKLMVEGTIKIDNSENIQNNLINARHALQIEDWDEVVNYYGLVIKDSPHDIEAIFFNAYGKIFASNSMANRNRSKDLYYLNNTISHLSEYLEEYNGDKENIVDKMATYMEKIMLADRLKVVQMFSSNGGLAEAVEAEKAMNVVNQTFLTEIVKICNKHPEYVVLKAHYEKLIQKRSEKIVHDEEVKKENTERERRSNPVFAIMGILFGLVAAYYGIISTESNDDINKFLGIFFALPAVVVPTIGIFNYVRVHYTLGKWLSVIAYMLAAFTLFLILY